MAIEKEMIATVASFTKNPLFDSSILCSTDSKSTVLSAKTLFKTKWKLTLFHQIIENRWDEIAVYLVTKLPVIHT